MQWEICITQNANFRNTKNRFRAIKIIANNSQHRYKKINLFHKHLRFRRLLIRNEIEIIQIHIILLTLFIMWEKLFDFMPCFYSMKRNVHYFAFFTIDIIKEYIENNLVLEKS